jgi:hypothetical protein
VIDLERLDAYLDEALSTDLRVLRAPAGAKGAPAPPAPGPPPAPVAPLPAPTVRRSRRPAVVAPVPDGPPPRVAPADAWEHLDAEAHGRRLLSVLAGGRLAEADVHLAAHAELVAAGGDLRPRRDAAVWAVMRAMLGGRPSQARAGLDVLQSLNRQAGDPDGDDAYWVQRLRLALEWGDEDERYLVLDHCRHRAWVFGDAAWQGRLTLLLAVLGRTEEARRELEQTTPACGARGVQGATGIDVATDLAEAAALLGDTSSGAQILEALEKAPDCVVVCGRGWIVKGDIARFRALAAQAAGQEAQADASFRAASEAHRRMGADYLVARTLGDWGRMLGERDPLRSAHLLRDAASILAALASSDGGQERTARAS